MHQHGLRTMTCIRGEWTSDDWLESKSFLVRALGRCLVDIRASRVFVALPQARGAAVCAACVAETQAVLVVRQRGQEDILVGVRTGFKVPCERIFSLFFVARRTKSFFAAMARSCDF